jgi:FlaA1/EpsC-like NDP-sugar epimerase
MSSILSLIGREKELFSNDIKTHEEELTEIVSNSRFLVVGAVGSIGQAVTKEILRNHMLWISVKTTWLSLFVIFAVRLDILKGNFQTFALDIGTIEYDAFIKADGQYDYVLNLSALKHVLSEKDPFTLMRLIDVNILNSGKTLLQSAAKGVKNIFVNQ